MPDLRHPVSFAFGACALLAGLVACASTVTGTAGYAGAGPTTTTTTTTQTTTTVVDPTTTGPSESELTACLLIPLSDVDAFSAFNDLADKPDAQQTQDMRDNVASMFDSAQMEVQTYIDPLPAGPIRDAAVDYHAAQVEVRDKLNAGNDVTTQVILDAQDVLQAECGTG